MKKLQTIAILIVIVLLFQLTITGIQIARYAPGYTCKEMSKDCEYFFESLGICTKVKVGLCETKINNYTIAIINGKAQANRESVIEGHCWLELDIFGQKIPFDSVWLLPIDPLWNNNYKDVIENEGFYDGNVQLRNATNQDLIE